MSDNFNIFGKSHAVLGTNSSDLILKCRGAIKIQWGNKFIDLIKDGKINVDAKFIYKEDEVGIKDGIYVIGEGDEVQVILKIGDEEINLKGEIGTTYVSFLGELITSPDEKYTALTNIGFLYKDLDSVDSTSLQNGLIYVEAEKMLYIVEEGALTELTLDIPNPYTKLLVIQKNDASKGAILIVGSGIANSLAFDSLYMYTDTSNGDFIFDSSGNIYFKIGDTEKIAIEDGSVVFSDKVIALTFQSEGASSDRGFRLYFTGSESTLEVDNLIVRNESDSSALDIGNSLPIWWYYKSNIIAGDIEEVESPDDPSLTGFGFSLALENEFEVGLKLYTWAPLEDEDTGVYKWVLLPLKVEELDTEGENNIVYVSLIEDLMDPDDLNDLDKDAIFEAIKGQTIFLISIEGESVLLLRRMSNNLDLIEVESLEEALENDKVTSRFGNIGELGLAGREDGVEVPIEGSGIYSNNGAFLKALYTKDYELPSDDNSTKFASTEWVHNNTLPEGAIIMFNGLESEIPDGWALCDGQNGTPYLIDKFIVGSNSSGGEGQLTFDKLATYPLTFNWYSMIYIMKLPQT